MAQTYSIRQTQSRAGSMNGANCPQSGHPRPSSGHHHNHLPFNPLPLFSPSTAPTRVPSLELPSPSSLQIFNFFSCLPLGTLLSIHRHSTSTTTTTHHEKKQKLNGSLAIANDSTYHLRVEPFHKSKDREHDTILHFKARHLAN
jgi:hypothetical protein